MIDMQFLNKNIYILCHSDRIFNKTEGKKSSANSLGELKAQSASQCSVLCVEQTGCVAANYDVTSLSCQLLSSPRPSMAATGYTLITVN